MKNILILLVSYLLLFAASSAASPIYVVNVQKVIDSSAVGKGAKADIERSATKLKDKLESKKAAVAKMASELEKQKAILSESALEKKLANLREADRDYRRSLEDEREALTKKQRERILEIVEQIREVVAEIADDEDLPFVLERNERFVLYASDHVDITGKVTKRFDEKVVGG